ncbi:MAG: pesticidal protein Cry7Aa [Bacteroidia bacterium]|jgi:predicted GH43/DUF377 family glycosyl hydrolase|nr:pesticidal protein Cry7Aa [Bacteroidia bacterium]
MITVVKRGIVLSRTQNGFECEGVLNPAILQIGNTVHLFYRAVAKGNYSTIGYCRLEGPLTLVERLDEPLLYPQRDFESQGMEDPRIVKLDDTYFLSYTAFDGINALGALATSTNLKHFLKVGLIVPTIQYNKFKRFAESKQPLNEKYIRYNKRDNILTKRNKLVFLWIKNVVFFPRKIGNEIYFLIRIKPDIQLVKVADLSVLTQSFWEHYLYHLSDNIAISPVYAHEVSYIGAGCPPIETEKGWLVIYHGVFDSPNGYIYTACAALLDLDNPLQVIARLAYPLFVPELDYELTGHVNNVCFPTGTSIFEDTLYIYYGAADNQIACASVSLNDLLDELSLT